jgi:hypothetical protein
MVSNIQIGDLVEKTAIEKSIRHQGRDYITLDDIPMRIRVVLSTCSLARATIFELLIADKWQFSYFTDSTISHYNETYST